MHGAEFFARCGVLMLLRDAAYCQDQNAGAEDLGAKESQGLAVRPKTSERVEETVMMLASPQKIVPARWFLINEFSRALLVGYVSNYYGRSEDTTYVVAEPTLARA